MSIKVRSIGSYLTRGYPNFSSLQTNEKWIKIITTILVALTLSLRGYDRLSYPQFVAEEGIVFFQDSYNLDFWSSVTKFYNGGSYLLGRLVAEFSQLFRLEIIPTIFVLASLAIATCCCCLFLHDRFKWIVPNLYLRSLFCIAIALFPSSNELVLRLVNAHWYLAIACFFLVLMEIPQKSLGKLLYASAWIISSLSAPLVIIFSPCLAGRAIADKKNRILLSSLSIFLISFAILIKQENSSISFVKNVDTSQASLLLGLINNLTYRVLLTSFLGDRTSYSLFHDNKSIFVYFPYVLTVLYMLFSIGTATVLATKKRLLDLLVWTHINYCILAPLLLTFLGRPEILLQSQSISTLWGSERYFFLPVGAFNFAIFWWIVNFRARDLRVKYMKGLLLLMTIPAFVLDFHIANIWITDHQWALQVQRIKIAEVLSPGKILKVPVNPTRQWLMSLRTPLPYLPSVRSLHLMEDQGAGYFDFAVAYGGKNTVIPRKQAVKAGGWAIDRRSNRPSAEVLVLDKDSNQVVARTRVNLIRTDVAQALQSEKFRLSGWQVVFPVEKLQPGSHTLLAYAFDSSTMQIFPLANEMKIEVSRPSAVEK